MPEPPRPDAFYKYMTAATARIVLGNRTIRWSAPARFNDPFDMGIPMGFGFDLAEMREPFRRRFEEMVYAATEPTFVETNAFVPMLRKFREAAVSRSREALGRALAVGASQMEAVLAEQMRVEADLWSRERREFRVLCVSEDSRSIPMWSHYAENHRGVVARLRCVPEHDSPLCAARPVRYSVDAPSLATLDEWIDICIGVRELRTDDIWTALVYTKHTDWAYEREWRAITGVHRGDAGDFEDTPFYPAELDGIYLGCNMTDEVRAEIEALLDGPWRHVELHQAVKVPRRFELAFTRLR